jgi:membrane-associated phospholipid phosphatase
VSPGEIDRALLVLARTRGHTPTRDRRIAQFSSLGEHGACWIALGLAGGVRERARDPERSAAWARGVALVSFAYMANTALKLIVRRPRPQLPGLPALIATPTRLGFPSAHATTSFAAARRYGRLMDGRPLYALAAALAASRLYLGVHHPSDVAAGAALGTAIAARGGGRWR